MQPNDKTDTTSSQSTLKNKLILSHCSGQRSFQLLFSCLVNQEIYIRPLLHGQMPQSLRKFLALQSNWSSLSLYFPLSRNTSPFIQISFDSGMGWLFTSWSLFQAYLPLFCCVMPGLAFGIYQLPYQLASC